MNQEGGASVHVAAQKTKALVSGVTRFHDDVVQLVAQEVIDYMLVAVVHFEKIGQHADWRHAARHRPRLEKPSNRLGGITVLGDDGFERALFTDEASVFRAQRIQMLLATGLGAAFLLEVLARLVDLRAKRRDALRSRLKLQAELPALSAEVLELLIRVVGLLF